MTLFLLGLLLGLAAGYALHPRITGWLNRLRDQDERPD